MPGKQILVLGGISDGTAFALLQHIVAHCQDVTFIRLADKHLLLPAAKVYLTFVDANTKAMCVSHGMARGLGRLSLRRLEQGSQEGSKPAIECLQANFAASGTLPCSQYDCGLTSRPSQPRQGLQAFDGSNIRLRL
jgi:hypothetical protein